MNFNVMEMNLICMFRYSDRRELLTRMEETLLFVDDPEMEKLMKDTMRHIESISDEEFAEQVFIPTTDDDGELGDEDEFI